MNGVINRLSNPEFTSFLFCCVFVLCSFLEFVFDLFDCQHVFCPCSTARVYSQPRLSTRCRGAPRRRGELRKVWDLACGFVQATKNRSPPPLTVARFGVLLPTTPPLRVGVLVFFA